MAKPPDGQSAWFHHSDSFQLTDGADNRPWASLSSEVADPKLTLGFSRGGDAWTSFTWLGLEVRDGSVWWTPIAGRQVCWTANSSGGELFEEAIVDASDGAVLGTARLIAPGHVRIEDRDRRPRIEITLGAGSSELSDARIEIPRGAPLVVVTIAGPLTQAQSSLP